MSDQSSIDRTLHIQTHFFLTLAGTYSSHPTSQQLPTVKGLHSDVRTVRGQRWSVGLSPPSRLATLLCRM